MLILYSPVRGIRIPSREGEKGQKAISVYFVLLAYTTQLKAQSLV